MGKRTSLRLPINGLDALALYPKSYYLNVSLPLQISASATAERSYTAQKRVENYFLTTMTKERLSELMRTFLLTFPFIWTAVVRRHKISEGMIFYPALSSTFVSTTHRAISEHIQMVIIPEYRDEINVGGGEVGEEAVSVRYETNRLAGRMKCVIVTANAPCVRNLHMINISNLPKPTYTAESAVSDFYAFILAIHKANEVRRTNNGSFNAMTDEEEQ
ncbi:hypothetical protein T09_8468 [Trichinella sp. T9]|nr:hypothetical protein T09_8468 [Trichinella sp. T9]